MSQQDEKRTMRTFVTIWLGQVVSLVGSSLTSFALGVWTFERTGSATLFALILTFAVVPGIVAGPFAGALVDCWDRRRVMILSDSASAVGTLAVAALLWAGRLELWHIYAVAALGSVAGAFQKPAYLSSIGLLVPREHLARASGMVQFGMAAAQVVAPLLAGFMLAGVGMRGVVLADFATFLVALGALLAVRIPSPAPRPRKERQPLWREARVGWSYLAERRGLLWLLGLFAVLNLGLGVAQALLTPLVLGFASHEVLGVVASAVGGGMLAGSVAMSTWGGPKRRVQGILGATLLIGAGLVGAGLRPSAPLVAASLFALFFAVPVAIGCSQAVWQVKVPAAVQGRVFATRTMIASSSVPVAFLLAGRLTDAVFEPLLAPGGALAGSVGALIGTGHGRGAALLLVLAGALTIVVAVVAALVPEVRGIEEALPDAVEAAPVPPAARAVAAPPREPSLLRKASRS